MSIERKFLKYIYSSAPLKDKEFDSLKHNGIFKNYFADHPFRKPILEKLQKSLMASDGGVFLISGYRGIGKTTFLNYILNTIKDSTFRGHVNLSEIKFDFKFELICRMIVTIQEELKKEFNHQFRCLLTTGLQEKLKLFEEKKGLDRLACQLRHFVSFLRIHCWRAWKCSYRIPGGAAFWNLCRKWVYWLCLPGREWQIIRPVLDHLDRLGSIEDILRFNKECRQLFELVFFELEVSQGINMELAGMGLFKNTALSYSKTTKQKENMFLYEHRLKKLLKEITNHKSFKKKFIFVLDELDKLPLSSVKGGENREDDGGETKREPDDRDSGGKSPKMEWLLRMLSGIKPFLFESGAVFILVVNKDVYDRWLYRHSQEDLFMNLVTNVEYLPSYTKEEMELSSDFPISLSEDVEIPYPLSPHTLKKYFQTTMYYESYGNPRLYFQNLSGKIKNNEIRITRDEAQYLLTKFKLFELNESIYNYVYKNNERIFGRFLIGIDEIRDIFQERIDYEKIESSLVARQGPQAQDRFELADSQEWARDSNPRNQNITLLFASYYRCLGKNRHDLREFWCRDLKDSEPDKKNFVYNRFEALLTILKQHDKQDNYPYTNYVIRRLTDFLRILEEKHFISIEDIHARLDLQEFELTDTVGRYLINLLIPLSIVILRNNGVLNINGRYLHYTYDYNSTVHYYHEGCEAELNGDFLLAFQNYNKFLRREPFHLDAHHRKLRLLYYVMKLGYYDEKVNVVSQWYDSLVKMKQYFDEEGKTLSDDWHMANYLFFRNYFLNTILDGQYRERYEKLLESSGGDDSSQIEEIYNRAIERAPLDANIKMWKGYFLLRENRNVAALDLFRESRRLYNEPLTLIREAFANSRLQNTDEACRRYFQAFFSTTSWLQKAIIIMHISEMLKKSGKGLKKMIANSHLCGEEDCKNLERNLEKGLEDFGKELKQKHQNGPLPANYYFLLKALLSLYQHSGTPTPPDLNGQIRKIEENDLQYEFILFCKGKTF